MQKAIFLDRDGTLNPDPGYISRPEDFTLYAGTAAALKDLKEFGYLLILVTNQSGIARGLITPEQLDNIHQKLQQLLSENNLALDAIYVCPHHPDFPYRGISNCKCRKPAPGMILQAIKDFAIDAKTSYLIGDRSSDVKAAIQAGITPILIGDKPLPGFEEVVVFANLAAASKAIVADKISQKTCRDASK